MKISDPNDKGIQYSLKSLIKDIWKYSGDRKKYIVLGTFFRLAGDVAGLYPVYALGLVVNGLTEHSLDFNHASIILMLWVISYIIQHLFRYIAKRLVFSTAQDVYLNIEKYMLGVLISKDSAWHEKESSGIKIKRIERGAMSYRDILYAYINSYIETFVTFVGIPFILLEFDSWIALIMLVFLIVYFSISKYLQKRCIGAAHQVNIHEDQLSGNVYEVVSNIRTIRVLHIGKEMMNKVAYLTDNLFRAFKNRIKMFQFRSGFMAIFSQVFKMTVLSYIVYSVFKGRYDIALIVMFSAYFDKIWSNIKEITDVSQDVMVSRQSIYRMYDLVGREVVPEIGTQEFPKVWNTLLIENLSFYYEDNKALNNLTFKISKGQKIGIVGLSGAGKSTLFKLLIRERDDYHGDIKIDNVSIKDIHPDEFYKHISIVPQDTEVFNLSLKENIIISQPSKKDDKELLENSLEIGHVKDYVHKLPNGIDTKIGEHGVKLSGGERQRLGIARAIFKEPSILLLDEATSHLDLESEEKIKDSLHKFFKNVTAVVIAHRLTTIKEMDKIIVIEEGGIIEEGSYDELMNKKGRFYELWQKQLF